MKFSKFLLLGMITVSMLIGFSNCEREGTDTIILPTNKYVEPLTNVIPKELINALDVKYFGSDPPNVMGGYLASPYVLTYSNLPHDSIGYVWVSKFFKFSKQTYENILVYESAQGDETVYCPMAYIQGSGKNFMIYFTETKNSPSMGTVKIAAVITGTLVNSGISNFKYSFMMIESNGNSVLSKTIRKFKDGNDLAEKYNW